MGKMIGKGWCVVVQKDCEFSQGHGADGKVICSCNDDCPEEGAK